MTTTATPAPDGLLLVDKPAGVSSHDLVLAVRASVGQRRVGHAGTLDPFATGLLVVMIGRATRLLPYLAGDPKVYEATVTFGAETSTEDFLGDVTRTGSLPTKEAVRASLPSLTGEVSHVPPAFSAKRVDGRRAYALARSGADVQLEPVTIRVDSWEVLRWHGDETAVTACEVRLTCGPGTYVRALAQDLGRKSGSAAHLTSLRRTRSGPFDVAESCSLPELRARTAIMRPALDAVAHLPREILAAGEVAAVVRGVTVPATVGGKLAALVSADTGALVALGVRRDDRWQPRVVMRPALERAPA